MYSRARIWIDELPEAALLSREAKMQTFVFENATASAHRTRVALEVLKAEGPMSPYGLLGGRFERTDDNKLMVSVSFEISHPEKVYPDSLAGKLDVALIGLEKEYASGIRSGIQDLEAHALPSGFFTLNCAACGIVGSSNGMFRSLSRALIRGLTQPHLPQSFDEVMQLMQT
jgi:hypothetical protein